MSETEASRGACARRDWAAGLLRPASCKGHRRPNQLPSLPTFLQDKRTATIPCRLRHETQSFTFYGAETRFFFLSFCLWTSVMELVSVQFGFSRTFLCVFVRASDGGRVTYRRGAVYSTLIRSPPGMANVPVLSLSSSGVFAGGA